MMIRISGLTYFRSAAQKASAQFSKVIRIPSNTELDDLSFILQREAPGMRLFGFVIQIVINFLFLGVKSWGKFKFPTRRSPIQRYWEDVFTTPVQVTSGRSHYNLAQVCKINLNQSIASFFSKVFPDPIQADLEKRHGNSRFMDGLPGQVLVGRASNLDPHDLYISFMRTVRVPDSKRTRYNLPPDLDTFPLFDIRPLSGRLPPANVANGGLMLPMYRKYCNELWYESQTQLLETDYTFLRIRSHVHTIQLPKPQEIRNSSLLWRCERDLWTGFH